MSFSKTIQMFIFDGNPNGRIMCELSNWNGRVYKISRNELSEFSQRDDSENTGVYFLFGKNEEGAALREDVDAVLKEMKEDGTLAEITEKYLGKDTSPDEKYFEETIN